MVKPKGNLPLVKKSKKSKCPCDKRWKDRNQFGCGKICDWIDLPYEKEAIIKRMKVESKIIQDIKQKVIKGRLNEREIERVMDTTQGMQIMVGALTEDFGMTPKEVKKEVGFKKDTWSDKMKMAMKLSQMKKMRRKK